jgi:hypothetical protein
MRSQTIPRGRVLRFLRLFQVQVALGPSVTVIQELTGDQPESAEMYLHMTQLRIQAESVPRLMEPYSTYPGYGPYYRNYHQILDATARLCAPAGLPAQEIFTSVDGAGWSALEFADDVLRHHSIEASITGDQYQQYLSQVRVLIDEVAGDLSLRPEDRSRIVDLLRKVEQALLDVKINGTLPVQEVVAAAGAIVRLSLWERIKSRPWVRDVGTVLVGIYMLLDASANALAIEQSFSDKPEKVIVVNHQDRQEQPTDQPTPEMRRPGPPLR